MLSTSTLLTYLVSTYFFALSSIVAESSLSADRISWISPVKKNTIPEAIIAKGIRSKIRSFQIKIKIRNKRRSCQGILRSRRRFEGCFIAMKNILLQSKG